MDAVGPLMLDPLSLSFEELTFSSAFDSEDGAKSYSSVEFNIVHHWFT